MSLQIEELGPEHLDIVAPLVEALLVEMGEEGEKLGAIDHDRLRHAWAAAQAPAMTKRRAAAYLAAHAQEDCR